MKKSIFLSIISLLFAYQSFSQYCTPTYNGPAPNPNAPYYQYLDNWYTHILKFSLGDLNLSFAAPYGRNEPIYVNYTGYSTDLVPGYTYPLRITVGNGGNDQTLSVWIDYNNNKVFETSEKVFTKIDTANRGDHVMRANITIPASTPLGISRIRVGTIYGLNNLPNACTNNNTFSQHFHDYSVKFVAGSVQTYVSTDCYQTVLDEVTKSSTNNRILGIQVVTNSNGTLSPLLLDTFYLSSLGTTNPAEISKARLYYTGKSPEFKTNNLIASTVGSPGSFFKLRSNQSLLAGTNYFWLTYDVASNAVLGNDIDARCNGVYIRVKRIPNSIDPTGTRKIGYAVSIGNKSNFVYISQLLLNNLNNYSYYNFSNPNLGYYNYLYMSDTLMKSKYHKIYVTTGNGANDNVSQAWIDFNKDGVFDPINERILLDSLKGLLPTAPGYGPVTDSFMIPLNSPVGPTRLRVTSHYTAANRSPAKPYENPVEVGEVEDYTVIIGEKGQPASMFIAKTACLGSPTFFYDQSYTFGNYQINDWVWYFGDGDTSHSQNPQHTYLNPGVYNVRLVTKTNYSGCIPGSITQAVNVNHPIADFSFSSNSYQTKVLFNDETSGGITSNWYWDFGDPQSLYNNFSSSKSPLHSFDTVGWYTVTFIATTDGGCIDTVAKTIYFDSTIAPVADFSAATFNPYFNQAVNLQDLSVNSPTNWTWLFTPASVTYLNGTTKNSRNPVVSFNTVAAYSVKLIVYNYAGIDSITKVITTKNYTKPVADFSANLTSVKAGQLVSFLDLSTNDPTNWQWLFGDNDTGRVQYPLHAYSNTGKYSVQLTSSNPAGNSVMTKANYISVSNEYDMCDNDASFSNLYNGQLYDDGGKNGNYSSNSLCNFLIKPNCSGPITLRFTMFDLDLSDQILVYDGEDAKGLPLFTGSGFTGSSLPPALVAHSGAMYIVERSNIDALVGQGFSAYWTATPNIAPLANIIVDTIGYIHGPVNFVNGTVLGTGNKYSWDYTSDGIIDDSTVTNGRHQYDSLGYFTVKLIAENCKGKNVKTVKIHIITPTQVPVADFTADKDTVVELEKVYFTDQSSMGPTSWFWEINSAVPLSYFFTDGTSEYSQNPVIQFFEVGPYDISLTATNSIGSSVMVTKSHFIYLKPKGQMCSFPYSSDFPAGRIFDSGGEDLNYNNGSTANTCFFLIKPCSEKVILNFKLFDYAAGDYLKVYDGIDNTGKPFHTGLGFSANALPPTYLIAESGSMYIEEVTSNSGTAAGFVADWSIRPIALPKAKFDCFDTAYTGGYVMNFVNSSTGKVDLYYWDYNFDGIADDSSKDGSYKFTATGTKNIQLTAFNCSGSNRATKNILVIDPTKKPKSNFAADRLSGDTSDVITFNDLTKFGPNTYKWRFNPSTVTYVYNTDSTSARPLVKFQYPGKYDVTLITSNSFGVDSMKKLQYLNIFTYCNPTVNNLLNDFGISKVVIKDINSTSAAGKTPYTNYSSVQSTTLELGGTYYFQINNNLVAPTSNRKIWIDFNQDGVFNDTTEKVAFPIAALSQPAWTGTFKVSPTAKLGQTRMRIGIGTWGYSLTPCTAANFGEYEDYRIYITGDLTPPEITLKGTDPTISEISYPYIDSGAIAWDAVDGDISSKISVVSTVNGNKLGTYTVKYNVSDLTGNDADQVVRTVYVTPDKTPPVVTLLGANPMILGVYSHFVDPGATANDNIDGNISNLIVVQGTVDSSRIDTFKLFYSAYDKTGNFSAEVVRTVYVKDTIPPIIKLKGPDTIFHQKGVAYVDSGAIITDNYYKSSLIQIIPSKNIDILVDGWYWFRYDAIDPSGNYAKEKVRVVKVGHPEGISDEKAVISAAVFPNPSSGKFTLSLDLNKKYDVSLDVIDPLGRVVQQSILYSVKNKNVNVDLVNQAQGVYLLRIKAGNNTIYKRVTIFN